MTLIMFFEFLIGLTDIYIAGRIGKDIQAAYGFVIQMYFVFIIIANALTAGTVSVISRLFTSGDKGALDDAVYSTTLTAVVSGVIFGAAGIGLTPFLINLVNIPRQLKPIAIPLGEIYAAGLLFHYIVINTNGILRACKRVRISLKTMSVVCAVNIGLNFFLVFHTKIGYQGIALSTAISVFVGSILNLRSIMPFLAGIRRFSAEATRAIITIGWPFALSQILWQLHSMALYLILSALPRDSVETLAAFAAGLRIESAIFLPAMAFNMANAVIAGNLIGENKREDAFRAGIITAVMGVIIVACLTLGVIMGARQIAPAISKNPVVVAQCIKYIYISMISEPFMAFWMVLGGALSGAGDTKGIMLIVSSTVWLIRIPLCYLWVVVLGFDATSVWWTMNLSQFMTAMFMVHRYWQKRWLGAVTQTSGGR
ncbi:MAG TPA: MATE family efflux transporter [Syntrophorhabdaceae bacterium]|nr:MATE family efflux transporter [Syntrophorhabdaceae bacterium]